MESSYLRIDLSASSVQSLTTKIIFFCCFAITFSEARTIAFKMWLWLASYLPISVIHTLMTKTSDRAKQNKAVCFSNIF